MQRTRSSSRAGGMRHGVTRLLAVMVPRPPRTQRERLAGACLLGIVGFFLLFALGYAVPTSPTRGGAGVAAIAVLAAAAGGYFMLVAFVLLRRRAGGTRQDWTTLLALISPLVLATLATAFEALRQQSIADLAEMGTNTLVATGGAWLGARAARGRQRHPAA